MSRVIITGGLGFIGSYFLNHYAPLESGNQFLVLDVLNNTGFMENIKDVLVLSNVNFKKCNINNKFLVNKIFKEFKPEFVINFAAETSVDYSFKNPAIFEKTNVKGLQNLLDASIINGVKKFIQISTDEVYGDVEIGDNTTKFDETSPLKPQNPYAVSKAKGDALCLSYVNKSPMQICITRSSNNFGPRQFIDKLIPHTLSSLLYRENIVLYGDGQNVRDWLFVGDNVKAIHEVVRVGINGEIYNISSQNFRNNITIVDQIIKNVDNYTEKRHDYEILREVGRKINDRKYSITNDKIKHLTNLEFTNFDDAFLDTIIWYLNHPDFIEKCRKIKGQINK
jgi:dTDP-glucose 4,6-dehydratase